MTRLFSTARFVAVAGLALALAACADRPRESAGTPVQPTAEAAPPVAAGAAPAPGSTIQWNEPGTGASATSDAPRTLPAPATPPAPGSAVGSAQSPVATGEGPIRWNAPAGTPTTVPGAPVGPAVNWRSGIQGDIVWVEIIDPASFYRVDRVELVAPDGKAFVANDINRTTARYDYSGPDSNIGVGMSSWGGSHHSGTAVGLGIGFPLGGRGYEREDNATHSVARFQLADPDTYRRTASQWSVRVRLLDQYGHASVARFAAPAVAVR